MFSGWLVLTPMGTSGRISFRVLARVIPANFHAENQSKTLAGSHPFSDTRPTLVLAPPRPPTLCLCDFVCAICAPTHPSLNSMIKQNSNFQEFNTLLIWVVLLLRDSCNGCYTLHWATCWMFVNWIFSLFCFWVIWTVIIGSKWHDDQASSYESGVEFDGVECL